MKELKVNKVIDQQIDIAVNINVAGSNEGAVAIIVARVFGALDCVSVFDGKVCVVISLDAIFATVLK